MAKQVYVLKGRKKLHAGGGKFFYEGQEYEKKELNKRLADKYFRKIDKKEPVKPAAEAKTGEENK